MQTARSYPLLSVLGRRLSFGVLTLLFVSIVIFAATQWLPGDAAVMILGRNASPDRLEALRHQLNLDSSAAEQYWRWLSSFLQGDLGTSLSNRKPVTSLIAPRLENSGALLALVLVVSLPISILAGTLAAMRRGGRFDTAASYVALTLAAIPEFVLAIGLIIVFSTSVFQWLPPVAIIRPNQSVLDAPLKLVLPVATLALAVFPYLFRMTRSLIIDVLESDYIEMARLNGLSNWRILFVHALPNAIGPLGQAVALVCAYLAGGVVVVEYIFGFPGIGQGLVNSVVARDIPSIQASVLILAAFYIFLNIAADIFALAMTPKARMAAR